MLKINYQKIQRHLTIIFRGKSSHLFLYVRLEPDMIKDGSIQITYLFFIVLINLKSIKLSSKS